MLSSISLSIYSFSTNFYFCPSHQETHSSPFENLADLKGLASILTSKDCDLDQWMAWKNEIKTFISEHSKDLKELDELFTTLTKWGMERNPHKTMAILVEIVSLELLIEVIRSKQKNAHDFFQDVFEWAAKNASQFPKPPETSFTTHLYSEWKKSRPTVLYFIPNLINICLGAFNFLDTRKRFTTVWEKYLLLEIVCKFLIIPYCLIKGLEPIIGATAKVYLVAASIIAAIGILMSCYQRWFRPIPDEIVNCTNLDKQMERGFIDPKVGQVEEMGHLIAALEGNANVLLIGLSGEGKTALVHHFIQRKHEGRLPKKLQKLAVHEMDCGLVMCSQSFGHSELINQTKDQMEGYEEEILLFFDEFHQIVANEGAFQAFKKRFLKDKPQARFIAAITYQEWEKLKKLDEDESFRREFYLIEMESASDEQIEKMMKDFQYRFAQDIPIADDAIEAIIEISAKKDYSPKVGRAAKAEKLFKTAVGLCRAAYHHHYVSVKLNQDELKANRKQVQKIKKIIAHQQKINTNYYRLTHLFSKTVVQDQEKFEDVEIDINHLENVDIFDEKKEDGKETKSVPSVSKESISQNDQIVYLWYCFYVVDALQEFLDREILKVDSQISIQVNRDLIDRVYQRVVIS